MHAFTLALLVLGCGNKDDDTDLLEDDEVLDDTADELDELDELWLGATLRVTEPQAGSILDLGDEESFTAVVVDAEGELMAFDDVVWTTDLDESWVRQGSHVEDDSLVLGTHTIMAEALLPNGDRVGTEVPNVQVLHPDTGLYVGESRLDVEGDIKGNAISAACFGVAYMAVDETGETAVGDTSCSIAVVGFELDFAIDFDLDIDEDGDLSGPAAMDLDFFVWEFDVTGEVERAEIDLSFADDVFGFAYIAGNVVLERVNRDPDALGE